MVPVSTSTKSIQRLFSEVAGPFGTTPVVSYLHAGKALLEVLYSIEPEVSTNNKTLGIGRLTSASTWAVASPVKSKELHATSAPSNGRRRLLRASIGGGLVERICAWLDSIIGEYFWSRSSRASLAGRLRERRATRRRLQRAWPERWQSKSW